MLLVNEGIGELDSPDDRPFGVLGTYAAVARLKYEGRETWLASVHTSPSRVSAEKRREDFKTRSCEAGPWWSDAFLAELQLFAGKGVTDAVIAGDFNQALAYDERNGHTCSREFFGGVASTGYVDVTSRDWRGIERPTRHSPAYQLDRVFASASLAGRVTVDGADLVHDGLSDHAAVRFSVAA